MCRCHCVSLHVLLLFVFVLLYVLLYDRAEAASSHRQPQRDAGLRPRLGATPPQPVISEKFRTVVVRVFVCFVSVRVFLCFVFVLV